LHGAFSVIFLIMGSFTATHIENLMMLVNYPSFRRGFRFNDDCVQLRPHRLRSLIGCIAIEEVCRERLDAVRRNRNDWI